MKQNILTKSINAKKSKTDGLRICVMRRIKPEFDFDIWIPNLAPSEKLLQDYVINKNISWEEFSLKYRKQVLQKEKLLIQSLMILSTKQKITLLCAEDDEKECHRYLLKQSLY